MKTFIFTLDDNNATRFINKRQSLDNAIAERIISSTPELYLKPASKSFFNNTESNNCAFKFFQNFQELPSDCVVFFEEPLTNDQLSQADTLITFKWNRNYPSLVRDRISLTSLIPEAVEEFEGTSHKHLSKITYRRA